MARDKINHWANGISEARPRLGRPHEVVVQVRVAVPEISGQDARRTWFFVDNLRRYQFQCSSFSSQREPLW
jgi:hypothetical protein